MDMGQLASVPSNKPPLHVADLTHLTLALVDFSFLTRIPSFPGYAFFGTRVYHTDYTEQGTEECRG